MRNLPIAMTLLLLLSTHARAHDPPNALTGKEGAEGWVLLFDGQDISDPRQPTRVS